LATNIHRLSTVLGRVADSTLQDCCGFGVSQFKILWMLHKHQEGVLQATIAKWLNQTEAAVSRQVGLLEEDGLIKKQVDPKNRRNHIIMLSVEGNKFAENAMNSLVKEYKPFFSVLSEAEQIKLNTMLEKIFFAVVKSEHKEGK
jgi:DNA-binding MarR family transcriptional regulator